MKFSRSVATMRLVCVCVAVLTASCATLSLPRANSRSIPEFSSRPKAYVTPTGLRVVVDDDPTTPLVNVTTIVLGGGSADPEGREGLSHLLAHASLRALTNGGVPYGVAFEQAGVSTAEAHTTVDATVFTLTGASATLGAWLPLELERLAQPLNGLDDATFAISREVVRNQLRERREMAEGADFTWLQAAAFPQGHPYRRPALGTHESLGAITLDAARAFSQEAFAPSKVTLHLTGHVNPQDLTALGLVPVEPPRSAGTAVELPPEPPDGVLSEHFSGVATPRLYLVWSLPAGFSRYEELIRAVARNATHGLQAAWNYDDDVMTLRASAVPMARASLLVVTVELFAATHPGDTVEHVLNYLITLSEPTSRGDDPARARHAIVSGYNQGLERLYEFEDPARRGPTSAFDLAFANRLDSVNWHVGLNLGPPEKRDRELREFLLQWVTRDRARGVLVRPTASTAILPPLSVPPRSVAVAAPTADTLARFTTSWNQRPVTETLPNGLRVVVVGRAGWPVASVTLTHTGGSATGPLGAAALAQEYGAPRLVTFGRPANYGLLTRYTFEPDVRVLSSVGRAENLANMLAQFSTTLTSQHVDTQLLAHLSRYTFPFREKLDLLPERVAERAMTAQLFPGSSLGARPVTADVKALAIDEVNAWNNRVTPRGAVLAIVGDVDPRAALELARTWLGGWSGDAPPVLPRAPLPKSAAPLLTRRPGATQVHLTWACRVPVESAAQRTAAEVLAARLENEAIDLLREKLGVTAEVESAAHVLRGGTGWVEFSAFVDASRFASARAELELVLTQLDPTVGFERARLTVARRLELAWSNASALSAYFSQRLARGFSVEEAQDPISQLERATPAKLAAATQQCLANVVESQVGDWRR